MLKMLLILFCFQFSMYIIRVDEVHGCCITNGAGGRKGAGSDRQDVASWLGPGFRDIYRPRVDVSFVYK